MRTVILVSYHHLCSKRKAGFHWIANAYKKKGWRVIFVTAPISLLHWLRGRDHRFEYFIFKEANKLIQVEDGLYSYVLLSIIHPVRPRIAIIDKLMTSLYERYRNIKLGQLNEYIEEADLVIFESTAALLLFERFKGINQKAKYVYRVSDDLRSLKLHPIIIKEEERILQEFDMVSVPSSYIQKQLSKFSNNVALHFHGINKSLFDNCTTNPYAKDRQNVVFVGNSLLDTKFLEIASRQFPNLMFHIIGPFNNLPKQDNIICYGEVPFQETVAYIKYADIGLQTRSYRPGAESLTDSLKVIQYTYCKLPIIAPDFLESPRKNTIYYKPNDALSIKQSILNALSFDRDSISVDEIYSWDELADILWEANYK